MEGQRGTVAIFLTFIFLLNPCHSIHNDTVNIGAIVDLDSWVGRVARTAINLALDDVNQDSAQLLNGTRLVLHLRDGRRNALQGASVAIDLLKEKVVAIIGPQTSEVAQFVSNLGDAANVPVISFSATSPLLSNHRFPYFVRMAHRDSLAMKAIAALVKSYGWRRIVVVFPDNEFGSGAINSLSDALRDVGSEIEYRSSISAAANSETIREELYKLRNMQCRVFVAHMNSGLCMKLFAVAHEIGMMGSGYVWITTDGFTSLWDVLLNTTNMASMQGLLGVKTYIPPSQQLKDFTQKWKIQFRFENPEEDKAELNQYGLWAYDTVRVIAGAISKVGSFNFLSPSSANYATDLTEIKILQEGKQLLQHIIGTNITGLSGLVQLSDGELSAPAYQVVNLVGQSYHVIGYWADKTQKLTRGFPSDASSSSGQISSDERLGAVIWPGGSTQVPRGWVIPTSGKSLKIGVPVKHGFTEFVSVTFDKTGNQSKVGGFCKDVFDAVLRRLPYALPYELIPYECDSYDELVYQVYLKKFDAVVGDTTILANRSNFVDFTQPFTESGLVMMVPTETDEANNAWAFMLPFTPGMWCITGAFFIFTGVVVWLLEHKVNPLFRGTPSAQLLTIIWFSFSTLFFSERERIVSSLSRMVIIIWLFVVLILTSSYTASLTSILTVQQIRPSITSVESVMASRLPVGYQHGSFVGNYLKNRFGIDKKYLKSYSTAEGYAEALSKGPNKGGVAAIFGEIPYIRLFLSQQCGYTMVGPTYRTGGLGFVFPKGSPLVPDVSRAVLSFSEEKEMQQIQAMYFNNTQCTNPGARLNPNRLGLESFRGLYILTGTASVLALIIMFGRVAYDFKKDPNVERKNRFQEKSISFFQYFNKSAVSKPERISGIDRACSTPNFTNSSPLEENDPLGRSTSSNSYSDKSLSFEEEHGAEENVLTRSSSQIITSYSPSNHPDR